MNYFVKVRFILHRIPLLKYSYHLTIKLSFIISNKLEKTFETSINFYTKDVSDSCNNLFIHRLKLYLRLPFRH